MFHASATFVIENCIFLSFNVASSELPQLAV